MPSVATRRRRQQQIDDRTSESFGVMESGFDSTATQTLDTSQVTQTLLNRNRESLAAIYRPNPMTLVKPAKTKIDRWRFHFKLDSFCRQFSAVYITRTGHIEPILTPSVVSAVLILLFSVVFSSLLFLSSSLLSLVHHSFSFGPVALRFLPTRSFHLSFRCDDGIHCVHFRFLHHLFFFRCFSVQETFNQSVDTLVDNSVVDNSRNA